MRTPKMYTDPESVFVTVNEVDIMRDFIPAGTRCTPGDEIGVRWTYSLSRGRSTLVVFEKYEEVQLTIDVCDIELIETECEICHGVNGSHDSECPDHEMPELYETWEEWWSDY